MAFYKNPIIEEPPRCIVCQVVVQGGGLVCSATCNDIDAWREGFASPAMDWEDEYADR